MKEGLKAIRLRKGYMLRYFRRYEDDFASHIIALTKDSKVISKCEIINEKSFISSINGIKSFYTPTSGSLVFKLDMLRLDVLLEEKQGNFYRTREDAFSSFKTNPNSPSGKHNNNKKKTYVKIPKKDIERVTRWFYECIRDETRLPPYVLNNLLKSNQLLIEKHKFDFKWDS